MLNTTVAASLILLVTSFASTAENRFGLATRSPETAVQYFFDALASGNTNVLLWVLTPEYGNKFRQHYTMEFVLTAWQQYELVQIDPVTAGDDKTRVGVTLKHHGDPLRGELALTRIGESWYVHDFIPHQVADESHARFFPQSGKDPVLLSRARIGGRRYSFKVKRADYKPSGWNPSHGDPPVSVAKAISLAQQEMKRLSVRSQEWEVGGVSLRPNYALDDWVYEVSFGGISVRHPGRATLATVPVLLTGEVVKGQ